MKKKIKVGGGRKVLVLQAQTRREQLLLAHILQKQKAKTARKKK